MKMWSPFHCLTCSCIHIPILWGTSFPQGSQHSSFQAHLETLRIRLSIQTQFLNSRAADGAGRVPSSRVWAAFCRSCELVGKEHHRLQRQGFWFCCDSAHELRRSCIHLVSSFQHSREHHSSARKSLLQEGLRIKQKIAKPLRKSTP